MTPVPHRDISFAAPGRQRFTKHAALNLYRGRSTHGPKIYQPLSIRLPRQKLNVICRECGLRKRYEVDALPAKVGDHCMPEFRMDIARALKCPNVENVYKNVWLIGFDQETD